MTRNQKLFGLALILTVIFGLFAITVYAQGPGGTTRRGGMPFGYGMHGGRGGMMGGYGHHQGMMGYGHGWMMGDEETMFEVAAEALGLETDELWDELRSGKSLLTIAEEQGVEADDLQTALLAEMEEHMAAAVENGYLAQEEADEMLDYMQENMVEHLNYMFGGGMWDDESMPHWGPRFSEAFEGMPCWEFFQDDGDDA